MPKVSVEVLLEKLKAEQHKISQKSSKKQEDQALAEKLNGVIEQLKEANESAKAIQKNEYVAADKLVPFAISLPDRIIKVGGHPDANGIIKLISVDLEKFMGYQDFESSIEGQLKAYESHYMCVLIHTINSTQKVAETDAVNARNRVASATTEVKRVAERRNAPTSAVAEFGKGLINRVAGSESLQTQATNLTKSFLGSGASNILYQVAQAIQPIKQGGWLRKIGLENFDQAQRLLESGISNFVKILNNPKVLGSQAALLVFKEMGLYLDVPQVAKDLIKNFKSDNFRQVLKDPISKAEIVIQHYYDKSKKELVASLSNPESDASKIAFLQLYKSCAPMRMDVCDAELAIGMFECAKKIAWPGLNVLENMGFQKMDSEEFIAQFRTIVSTFIHPETVDKIMNDDVLSKRLQSLARKSIAELDSLSTLEPKRKMGGPIPGEEGPGLKKGSGIRMKSRPGA